MKKGKKSDAVRNGNRNSANVVSLRTESTAFVRTPWNGFEQSNLPKHGGPLLAALFKAANEKGHTLSEMATQLGVTYGYVAQLRNGLRLVEHISANFAHACALYLDVPPFTVKVMAGQVNTMDFLEPSQLEGHQIDAGLRRIADDPLVGGFMPAQLWQADIEVKAFMLMLYEEASGAELFAYRRVPEVIESAMKAAALLDAAQRKQPKAKRKA